MTMTFFNPKNKPQSAEDWNYKEKRRRAAEKQNGKCYWCGREMNDFPNHPLQVSIDHLIPIHQGGTLRPGNYVAACRECNSFRHSEATNQRKATDPLLVATTGETFSSPFEKLKDMARQPRRQQLK